jgi:hypothetical protein
VCVLFSGAVLTFPAASEYPEKARPYSVVKFRELIFPREKAMMLGRTLTGIHDSNLTIEKPK